ncbi:MAG: DUF839 domain-containing protein [Alphaproteobacteria bacterium]|nr:DUF839 domain-containing protein [Alphaproteobacteria bacterium]
MAATLNRRRFLSTTAKAGATVTLASTLMQLSACGLVDGDRPAMNLRKDPDGLCNLPEGFNYTVISGAGETMSDGHNVPAYHDGMGCFAGPKGEAILVRNHEIPVGFVSDAPSPVPAMAYDPAASGGTTTIWLNDALEVTKHHISLTGTIRNCSGGITPWNTWISSEEAGYDGWKMGTRHGYNFEVNPLDPLKKIEPLKAMGRFNHEAVAIDPAAGIAYQTEDNTDGCFYRFLPTSPGKLLEGGTLQALAFRGNPNRHTTDQPLELGKPYPCDWITIDEPDPEENTVAEEARSKGAATFIRGEGITYHDGSFYFTCTDGGAAALGQLFQYTPDAEGGTVALIYESADDGFLVHPDNIVMSPWGDLVICEDHYRRTRCLVGLTPDRRLYYIAGNERSEWAGACWSPDGKTLFANIQKDPGLTIAIRGPWESLRASA